jgi:Flp pilus assembly protein CpaB
VKTSRKRLGRPSFRGLLATRHGALALAVSCALVAVGILLLAMSQYKQTITGSTKQSTVLVSTAEIQPGVSASVIAARQMYKVVPVLETQVAVGAITNAGSIVGKVTASTILPGEQLTTADFTTPTGASAVLTPTERAVAVTLDSAHGVAGILQAGDHVDVYADVDGTGTKTGGVSLLIPDALVLRPASVAGGSVLLGLNMDLSPRVMYAFDNDKVWLELRGANAVNPPPTITGLAQILLGNQLSTTATYPTTSSTGKKP